MNANTRTLIDKLQRLPKAQQRLVMQILDGVLQQAAR